MKYKHKLTGTIYDKNKMLDYIKAQAELFIEFNDDEQSDKISLEKAITFFFDKVNDNNADI